MNFNQIIDHGINIEINTIPYNVLHPIVIEFIPTLNNETTGSDCIFCFELLSNIATIPSEIYELKTSHKYEIINYVPHTKLQEYIYDLYTKSLAKHYNILRQYDQESFGDNIFHPSHFDKIWVDIQSSFKIKN